MRSRQYVRFGRFAWRSETFIRLMRGLLFFHISSFYPQCFVLTVWNCFNNIYSSVYCFRKSNKRCLLVCLIHICCTKCRLTILPYCPFSFIVVINYPWDSGNIIKICHRRVSSSSFTMPFFDMFYTNSVDSILEPTYIYSSQFLNILCLSFRNIRKTFAYIRSIFIVSICFCHIFYFIIY